jgi:hypothetical protein
LKSVANFKDGMMLDVYIMAIEPNIEMDNVDEGF